jgi:8-oxo-dGTP pyrophosphatase MutT (NUDIX family)
MKQLENAEILTMCHNSEQNFFSSAIFYKMEKGKVFFLIVDYRRDGTGPLQIKFPGECSNEDESPFDNLLRESRAEVGLFPAKNGGAEIILHQPMMPRQHGDPVHHKIFFLIHHFGGALKTVTGSDAGEASPLYWIEADDLAQKIFAGHKAAFKRAVEFLQKRNRDYAFALMNVTI